MLRVGIIGLPNVGKSTLFNAIMGKQAALTAPYPFATVESNVGVVDVPDTRLDQLHGALVANPRSDVVESTPIVHASIQFVDIAGLVKGAAEGQGLGNQFLSHIRDVDAILHVLRDFDAGVPRADDSQNPVHDAEIVQTELQLKDLELAERKSSTSNTGSTSSTGGGLAKKPVIYAINVDEERLAEYKGRTLHSQGSTLAGPVEIFSAKVEEEIARLSKSEQIEYLKVYGLKQSSLDRIITECFSLLGLISFFTAGKIEVRAWPVRRGSLAPAAARTIHTDFERLFIRAEVVDWKKLFTAGSWKDAKEKGWVRTEGRDYIVADGEVCNFLIGK